MISNSGGTNLKDSVPLNGSDTNNGTRGFIDGPDLVELDVRPAQNQIAYVFDQEVRDFSLGPSIPPWLCELIGIPEEFCEGGNSSQGDQFKYIDIAGEEHFSHSAELATAPGDGRERVVIAQFGELGGVPVNDDDVDDAEIAVADPGAVLARTEGTSPNERFALTVPGASGDTTDADLDTTELVNGGNSNQMRFTYGTERSRSPTRRTATRSSLRAW